MHTLAFPSLYRTVYLCLAPHIENISDRIISENDTTRLQIGTHLRNLVFDDRYDDSEEDLGRSEALARFQSAIPKLKRLNSMSWESSWLPENPSVFQVFQQSCPELGSVSLYISSPWFNFGDENYLRSLFSFRDKSHISLCSKRLDPNSGSSSELPKTMIDMIRASPNLESLELDLRDDSIDLLRWLPDQLCSALNTTFPNLRVLRTLGTAAPDWESFFEDPENSAYRQFLQNHPKLHTVSMGWVLEHSWQDVSAESVATLFPSLRHFEGPLFICRALASSSVAAQLESLSALDESLEGDEIVELSESAVEMPNLRSLSFGLQDDELNPDAVAKLLSLAPNLTKLAIWSAPSDLGGLVDILKGASNLEELTMHIDKMLEVVQAMGESTASALVRELAQELPNLRVVHDWSQPKLQRSWVISRTEEDEVNVAHVQLVLEGPLGAPFPILPETVEE
ncbi:hypothetical protein FRC08_017856 [Ceratobasidium sp. 394]|nr:hypothetical protein FRC08_017856 [Ceratobasidium sp. 394]